MDLTLVTCNYNTPDLIVNLLRSLKIVSSELPKVLVVDTSSEPDSEEVFDSLRIPYVRYKGMIHGEGVNFGMSLVQTRYMLLTDSDIVFLKDWLPAFEKFKCSGTAIMGKMVGDRGGKALYPRIEPHFCFIDLDQLRPRNINFFAAERTKASKEEGKRIYDIGSTMFEDIVRAGLTIGDVNMEEKYFRHYEGMSWRVQSFDPTQGDTDIDFGGTHPNRELYDVGLKVQEFYKRDTQWCAGVNIEEVFA